jgi:hypothetical protein
VTRARGYMVEEYEEEERSERRRKRMVKLF